MKLTQVIRKRVHGTVSGARIDGDVSAAAAVNVGERGAVTQASTGPSETTTKAGRK